MAMMPISRGSNDFAQAQRLSDSIFLIYLGTYPHRYIAQHYTVDETPERLSNSSPVCT